MKTSYSQLKLWARRALLGNYSLAIGAELAMYGITMGVMMGLELFLMIGAVVVVIAGESAMTAYTVVMFVLIYGTIFGVEMMLTPGVLRMYMNLCTGQKAKVGDIFFAFKNHRGKFALITLAVAVIMIVIMAPMIVLLAAVGMTGDAGGFLVAFSVIYWIVLGVATVYVQLTFGMFYFIIIEDPDKGILQALSESRQMMRGNRCRYFGLGLSFLGILALAYMSLGIGMLWIVPYLICTNVFFYLDLKPVVEVYQPQWEMAGMQGETFVEAGYTEMPSQVPAEPGYTAMPSQVPAEPGYTEMPEQAPVEPEQPQSSAQPDDIYESYESQNW